MRNQKIIVGFEVRGTGTHHSTHIIRTTMAELREALTARFAAMLDSTDDDGPFKALWDTIDFGECDNFWVSGCDDDRILLSYDASLGIFGERPESVLCNWVLGTAAGADMEVRQ